MKYILHRCNDANRLRQGLDDPRFDGVEIDFYFYLGQVCIGHEPGDIGQGETLLLPGLGEFFRATSKVLVMDIKSPSRFRQWKTDEGLRIIEAVQAGIPVNVPIFVTGITHNWIPLVRRTVRTWNGRPVAYFVDAYSLDRCQARFRKYGAQFGLNFGYPTSLAKKMMTDLVPGLLEAIDETSELGKGLKRAFQPLSKLEQDAWQRADLKMAWTITSDVMLEDVKKLNPDYIIVEE